VSFVNSDEYEYLFPVANYLQAENLVGELCRLVSAAAGSVGDLSSAIAQLIDGVDAPDSIHQDTVAALRDGGGIFVGQIGMRHPRFSELRLLGAELARLTGAALGYLPEGANSAGLSQAGVLPHRGIGGESIASPGSTAADICSKASPGLLLVGVEPELDCANGAKAIAAVEKAEFVVALSSFSADSLILHADVILPMGTFAETSGTFVNAAGEWQSFSGVAQPLEESRPGWKILRVLGNLLDLPECDYETSEAVRDELKQILATVRPDNQISLDALPQGKPSKMPPLDELDVPIYRIDSLVRRAHSLQCTRDGQAGLNPPGDDRKIA